MEVISIKQITERGKQTTRIGAHPAPASNTFTVESFTLLLKCCIDTKRVNVKDYYVTRTATYFLSFLHHNGHSRDFGILRVESKGSAAKIKMGLFPSRRKKTYKIPSSSANKI